jgi:hypothetical protein
MPRAPRRHQLREDPNDLPPVLDGWDELSRVLHDDLELRLIQQLGSGMDADAMDGF